MRVKFLFTGIALLFFCLCYTQELSRAQLEKQSLNFFKEKNYEEAITGLEKLIELYPKVLSYNYLLGRSYLQTNRNLEEAINYLRTAASKNYKSDVHYFLALSYYNNYQFDNAENALTNFINLGKKRDILTHKPDNLRLSIDKARQETSMSPDLKVLTTEEFLISQVQSIYELHVEGKFIAKPDAFVTSADKKYNYQGLMYIPERAENGCRLYIPAIGKTTRTGKDLFEVVKITEMNYSLPVALKSINTSYDEEFPYYDYNTNTLFFSSNRPGGLGGYDIYKSKYNCKTKEFEEPRKLDFPFNTPFDDYLYVPNSKGENVIFISNRNNNSNLITAYKIDLTKELAYLFPKSVEEIRQIAQLPVKYENQNAPIVIENIAPARKPRIITEYDRILQKALDKQLTCDSLQAIIISKKNQLRVEKDLNKRRVLLAAITKIEADIENKQKEADTLFTRAVELNNKNSKDRGKLLAEIQQPLVSDDKYVKVEAEYGTLKLYAYRTETYIPESHSEPDKRTSEQIQQTNHFKILQESPYSVRNPIPVDNVLPDGLIYRIQLGAYSKDLPMNAFGGLTPLSAEEIEEKNLIKYFVGVFITSSDTRKALEEVKKYGYNDAFIVPYYNRQKITIQAAREIEFGEKK